MSERPEPANRPASGGSSRSSSSSRRRRGRGRGRSGGGSGSGSGARPGGSSRGAANSAGKAGKAGTGGRGGTGARPAGSGSSSGSRSGAKGTAGQGRPVTVVAEPVRVLTAPERSPESNEDSVAAHANRRRALTLCVLPWLVLGVLVGVVLTAAGLALIGLCAFVGVTVVGSLVLWRRASHVLTHALGARACREAEQPRVYNLVEGLCATMGLPVPEIRVVDSPTPNAMAVGRDPRAAVVVVTSGLAESLTLVELEGVLAHELVHVKRHDTVLGAVAVCVARPWALVKGATAGAATVHRLVGRGREFAADERAVAIVRYPPGLRSALDSMVDHPASSAPWPSGSGRTAALTRWLWIDPFAGTTAGEPTEGELDDTRVRAAALSLR
jgi:Zn-dependent protease with chaperone function